MMGLRIMGMSAAVGRMEGLAPPWGRVRPRCAPSGRLTELPATRTQRMAKQDGQTGATGAVGSVAYTVNADTHTPTLSQNNSTGQKVLGRGVAGAILPE